MRNHSTKLDIMMKQKTKNKKTNQKKNNKKQKIPNKQTKNPIIFLNSEDIPVFFFKVFYKNRKSQFLRKSVS